MTRTETEYVTMRPGWMEKLLLLTIMVQIGLLLWFFAYGSQPARDARDGNKVNRELLCAIIYNQAPERYEVYARYCPSRN